MNIWIFNHYSLSMYENEKGRHYWFGKELIKNGNDVKVFSAIRKNKIKEVKGLKRNNFIYYSSDSKDVPYIFIKTPDYKGNGIGRIRNMFSFYRRLFVVSNTLLKKEKKPDIIYSSSVHPLTLVAGIQISKKLKIPCICEVRDLWPESLVAYGYLKKNSLITRLLYLGEKWIYMNADAIIMTWEGGKKYILDKKWNDKVNTSKIYHINNGVDITQYDKDAVKYTLKDEDLNSKKIKLVYTGSIKKVNNIGVLLDAMKILLEKNKKNIELFIYGDGYERKSLEDRCIKENLKNVKFKGKVERKFIPYILKKADVCVLHNSSTILDKYGQSQNKLFEYLASGKPIIQTYRSKYNIINRYKCGITLDEQTPEQIANGFLNITNKKNMKQMGINSRLAAKNYDVSKLAFKLEAIINKTLKIN